MFVNHYERSLDSKHRVVLPAKFRSKLGERVYLAQLDNSLAVYSEKTFEEVSQRLIAQLREQGSDPNTGMGFAAFTVEIEFDSAGRITIPQRLREFANLTDEVTVVGALEYVQIWDRDTFAALQPALTGVVQDQFRAGGIT